MVKHLHKLSLLLFACLLLGTSSRQANAQINLSTSAYSQNFDGLPTLPASWEYVRYAGTSTAAFSVSTTDGGANAGGVYSVGSTGASDRAFGMLASGSNAPAIGASFKNASGNAVTGIKIDATMEQWRSGSSAAVLEKSVFEYSTDATSLLTGTWTPVESLDLVEKLTTTASSVAVNGNDEANKTAISGTIMTPLAAEAVIWIRWRDADASGSDGIYAVDDLTVQLVSADVTAPTLVSSTPAAGATNVATQLDLVLTFNEPVVAGTGQVTLTSASGSMSRAANDPEIVYSGATVTIKNLALQTNTTYTLTTGANTFKDAAGNFFAGLTGSSLSFTTSATATPVLSTSVSNLQFLGTAANKLSAVKSYEVTSSNLTGDVTVAVTGPFQIAKRAGAEAGNFGTAALTYTQAELAAGEKVFVRFAPTAVGTFTGSITHIAANVQNKVVQLIGYGINPYVQTFNDPNFLTNSGWTQVSVSGPANNWMFTATGPNTGAGAAVMNGFSDTDTPSNDWLISPAMDLTSMSDFAVLTFFSRKFFAGPALKLYVSTTYNGSGTINAADWTEVEGDFPTATGVWKESAGINLSAYKSAHTYVAFVYQTTAGGSNNSSEWKLDDFKVENMTTSALIPTTALVFPETAANAVSVSQSLMFNALGHGNITITAPTGFQVSTNNTTFTSSVVVPATTAETGTSVYVRFAPTTKQSVISGTLAFTGSIGNFSASGPKLTGSSLLRSETLDVVTYNVEFFASDIKDGNTEYGPTNDALQVENVTKVMQALNADIIAVQELSEETEMDKVVAALPGFAKSISQVYSYSIKPNTSTDPFPAQKIGFLYNTATVKPLGFRAMFETMYRQAVAGTTTLITDDFWSSGRLPYMGTFEVTIDGITKRIRVVNIHSKSGSSNSDFNRRVEDLKVLKDTLDTYYPLDNIILLGDYNDNVFGSINAGNVSTYNSFITDAQDYKAVTYTLAQNGGFSFPSSNSFLDHLIISNELFDDHIDGSTTVEDPSSYISSYSTTTSDHFPVYTRFLLTANDPLGVKEDRKSLFRISPNPTNGHVSLHLPAAVAQQTSLTAVIYTLRGEVVGKATGSAQEISDQLAKQLTGAASGLYLIKVKAGEVSYQTRIIKN